MKINALLTAILLIISSTCIASTASDFEAYQKTGHKSPKWDSFVEAGFSSFGTGNMGSAEIFLQRAIAKGCNDGLVYSKIGLYFESQKNYKKALGYFQKAHKTLPSQYPNHEITRSMNETLGRILFLNDEKKQASVYLQKVIDQKEDFTSLYFLGQIKKENGEFETAIKLFERSLNTKYPKELSPNVGVLIMTDIGKTFYELKNFDSSLKWWNTILKIDPNNETALSYKIDIEKQKFKEHEQKVIRDIIK